LRNCPKEEMVGEKSSAYKNVINILYREVVELMCTSQIWKHQLAFKITLCENCQSAFKSNI
jgi:hypothetical protein